MKLIYKSKQMGKTTELIEKAKKLKGYNLIVCVDRVTAVKVWKIIIEKKYNLPQPISFDELVKGQYYGNHINAFLIDDADKLIQYISKGVKVHAVTFNKEVEK